MFGNISSLLSATLLQKYSFFILIESIFCIALDLFIVLIKEMNEDFPREIQLRPEFIFTVNILGQGIWAGLLGITVAIFCNKLQQEKFREQLMPLGIWNDAVLHLEAGLFAWCLLVSMAQFVAMLLSGYSALGIVAHELVATQVELAMAILILAEIIFTLGLCLTVFSLLIFSFNALLPVYFNALVKKLAKSVLCKRYSSDRWKQNPSCDFSQASFVGSSVEFKTIDALSDLSIPTLTRKLAQKRFKDSRQGSFASSTAASSNSNSSNRSELLLI